MNDDTITNLKETMVALREQFQNVQCMNSKLEDEDQRMESAVDSLIEIRENELATQRRSDEQKARDATAKVNKVQRLNKELIHALNDQVKQLQLEQQRHGELRTAHRAMNCEKEEVCAQMAALQTSMKAQQRQLSQLCLFQEQMTNDLKSTKMELATTRRESKATQSKLEAEAERLTAKCDELATTITEQRCAKQSADEEIDVLRNSLTTQEQKFETARSVLTVERDGVREMVQRQQEREGRLVSALEEVTEKLRISTSEKERLELATKKELAEVSLLKMQCDELEHLLQHKNEKRKGVHRGLDRLKSSLQEKASNAKQNGGDSARKKAKTLKVKVHHNVRENNDVSDKTEFEVDVESVVSAESDRSVLPNSMKQQLEELENEMALQQHQIALLEDQRIRLEEEKTVTMDALQ